MSKASRPYFKKPDTYRQFTRRPLNCLWFVLPMLVAFHVGMIGWKIDLTALGDIHHMLGYFEVKGVVLQLLPPTLVVLVLLIRHAIGKHPGAFQPGVLLGMGSESIVGILPLIAIDRLTGKVLLHAAGAATLPAAMPLGPRIALDLGAGVYEEFIFRMLLMGLIVVIFSVVLGLDKDAVTIVAVATSATAFSLYHFQLAQIVHGSAAFPWREFIFHAVAGAYLSLVYIARGFGVAAGVHACFNICVTLGMWQGG